MTVSSLQCVAFYAALWCTALHICNHWFYRPNIDSGRVHCLHFKVLYNSPHPEIQAQMLSAENALICFIIVPPFQPSVPLLAGPPLPRFLFPTRISHFPRIYPTSSSTANKWAQEFPYIVQACVATLSFIMPPILIHSLS